MARAASARDLIPLPRLSAPELVAFLTKLETSARAVGKAGGKKKGEKKPAKKGAKKGAAKATAKLPKEIASICAQLSKARQELEDGILARDSATTVVDPTAARDADRAIDAAWRAFERFLDGWSQLEDEVRGAKERRERVRNLYEMMFHDGLVFITRDWTEEWGESNKRLKLIADRDFTPLIEELGGRPFLNNLLARHRTYGEVLHITEERPEIEDLVEVRPLVAEAQAAAREYIGVVIGYGTGNDRARAALANRLLRPYTEWQTKPTKAATADPAKTDPVAPPAPAKPE